MVVVTREDFEIVVLIEDVWQCTGSHTRRNCGGKIVCSTCCFPLWFGVQVSLLALCWIPGPRVGVLVTGAPLGLNGVLFFFCTAKFLGNDLILGVRGWRRWLRNCATSRKFVGSILDCVSGSFH